jgi:hypothetical protein
MKLLSIDLDDGDRSAFMRDPDEARAGRPMFDEDCLVQLGRGSVVS